MLESAANQGFFSGGLWSGVCFAIGIGALLWVFRRSILLRRRAARRPENQRGKQLAAQARRTIDAIDSRTWLNHYKRAVKFQRGQPVSPENRRFLREMTQYQQTRGDA